MKNGTMKGTLFFNNIWQKENLKFRKYWPIVFADLTSFFHKQKVDIWRISNATENIKIIKNVRYWNCFTYKFYNCSLTESSIQIFRDQ